MQSPGNALALVAGLLALGIADRAGRAEEPLFSLAPFYASCDSALVVETMPRFPSREQAVHYALTAMADQPCIDAVLVIALLGPPGSPLGALAEAGEGEPPPGPCRVGSLSGPDYNYDDFQALVSEMPRCQGSTSLAMR